MGSKAPVHPNDHVNMGQSSNDVIPTAIRISGAEAIHNQLIPALKHFHWHSRPRPRPGITSSSGRTPLMDATPASGAGIRWLRRSGHTASDEPKRPRRTVGTGPGLLTGTGINRPVAFPELAIRRIAGETGLDFTEASNHLRRRGARRRC